MRALKLQQFQYNLKKFFLRRLVFPMLYGPSDSYSPLGRGHFKGGRQVQPLRLSQPCTHGHSRCSRHLPRHSMHMLYALHPTMYPLSCSYFEQGSGTSFSNTLSLRPPAPPCNLPPFVRPVPPRGGGGTDMK